MRCEWNIAPLRELVAFISKGIAPSYTDEETETTIKVLNQKCNRNFQISYSEARLHDLTKKAVAEARYVQSDDIIINSTGTGTAGRIAQINEVPCKTTVDGHMIIIRANERVTQKYLGYALKSHQREVLQLDEGSTGQTELNRERLLSEITICYPKSLAIQEKITSFLSALDDKIELNQRINDNLERQVSIVFDERFVDFTYTNGTVPDGWHQGVLGDVADITSGKRPTMKQTYPSPNVTIPLVGAASIMGYTNQALYSEPILVTGRVGTHGVVQRFQTPCWASDNALVIKSPYYEFVYQVLRRVDYKNMNRGSTQPLITQTDLKNVRIVLPTVESLQEFEAFAGSLMALYEVNRIENARLAELRDNLLPQLISGTIDISKI